MSDDEHAAAQPGEIMTVAEAAAFLGLNPQTVRSEIRAQRLPAKRIGKEWRLSRTAIIAWLSTPADAQDLERYTRTPPPQPTDDADEAWDVAAEDPATYDPGSP